MLSKDGLDHCGDLLVRESQLEGSHNGLLYQRTQFSLALPNGPAGLCGLDHHAFAANTFEDAVRFQAAPRFGDGHHVDLQVSRHLANTWQQVSRRKPTAGDHGFDLVHDLPIDGHTG